VLNIAKQINEESKSHEHHSVEAIDETVLRNAARYANSSLVCHCAFFGGIIAQEIVKFTGKYTPLK
jgi:ubiquitin-activating enzyme E1